MQKRKQAGIISQIGMSCITGHPTHNDEATTALLCQTYEKQRTAHHTNSASSNTLYPECWCVGLAQAVRWSVIPEESCSSPGCCSKYCDLQAAITPCKTWRSGGTAHEGGRCDKSIGSIVSDAIVRSWLWSTATRSSPLYYFSILLQVVDN